MYSFNRVKAKIERCEYKDWFRVISMLESFQGEKRMVLTKLAEEYEWPLTAELRGAIGKRVGEVLAVKGEGNIRSFQNGDYPNVRHLFWDYRIDDFDPMNEYDVSSLVSCDSWERLESLNVSVYACSDEFKYAFQPLLDSSVLDALQRFELGYHDFYGQESDFSEILFHFLKSDVEEVCISNMAFWDEEIVIPSVWNPSLRSLSLDGMSWIDPYHLKKLLLKSRFPRLERLECSLNYGMYGPYRDNGFVEHLVGQDFDFESLDLKGINLISSSYKALTKAGFAKSLVHLGVPKSKRESKGYLGFVEALRDKSQFPDLTSYSLGEDDFVKLDSKWVQIEKNPNDSGEIILCDFDW